MAGGGAQPTEGAKEVGATVHGIGKGGNGCPEVGNNLRGGGPGGSTVCVRDVGDDTTHWEGFGRIPPQDVPQADGTSISERERR